MEIRFLYQGQQFLWDAEKAAGNVAKHGIPFEDACEVFFDPFVVLVEAGISDEMRDAAIGLAEDWELLFVVHVIREEDVIRIVSARKATAQERRVYENE